VALLGVPGFYSVGLLFAANFTGFPHTERLVVVWFATWVGAFGTAWLLRGVGIDQKAAVYSSFILWAGVATFGGVGRSIGASRAVVTLAVLAVAIGFLTHRRSNWAAVDVLVVVLAVALASGPLVAGWETTRTYGESTLDDVPPTSIELSHKPDIWLVVVDGYPSTMTLESDLMVSGSSHLAGRLVATGFDVPESVWAPYVATRLVVPTILDMDYVASGWTENGATIHDLHEKISGDNELIDNLTDNGYETLMIESGWSGGACGGRFRECSASPLYDEAFNRVLHRSLLSELPISFLGLHFSLGTQSTMGQLLELANDPRPDGATPRFVFAHLLTPHAPFFLDASCSVVLDERRQGFFFPFPGVSGEVRDRFFLEQLSCLDDFIIQLQQAIDSEAVFVLVSDHGTDRRAQTTLEPTGWTSEAMRERFGTLAAVRAPYDCPVPDPLFSVNLMRVVLSCLSESELPNHPPRVFLGPGVELTPAEMQELISATG